LKNSFVFYRSFFEALKELKGDDKYPELIFDVDNGLTLCKECHQEIHRKAR
jgi:hypothetical protein